MRLLVSDTKKRVGVIGGSGLYAMEAFERVTEHDVETPLGKPSAPIVEGVLGNTRFFFLPRHGLGHRLPPHRINYRANILALKHLGVEQVVSISAVGSMQEHIRPGDIVLVDQFIDRTHGRSQTFFEDIDAVAHVEFAEPIDAQLAQHLHASAQAIDCPVHARGTYLCIQGPQFSTRAESLLYRSWNVDVIGMTNMTEARLAREAELPYATMAIATDYDCWRSAEEAVTVESVLAVLQQGIHKAQRILIKSAEAFPDVAASPAISALSRALLTPVDQLPEQAMRTLKPLFQPYLEGKSA